MVQLLFHSSLRLYFKISSMSNVFIKVLPVGIIMLMIGAVYFWVSFEGRDVAVKGVPIPKAKLSNEDQVKSLKGDLKTGTGKSSQITGDWSRFRGPDLDGISKDKTPLNTSWGKKLPVIWEMELAKGHGGAVIHKGRVYVLDYDNETMSDLLRCFSLETSEEIWSFRYPIKTKTYHGITRSVPAVNDKYVVTIGPKAQVFCLRSDTGEFLWSKSLVLDYETEIPKWYSGQCPLLEGDVTIIAPSGPKGFIAKYDCETGRTIWLTENTLGWDMTHTSIAPMKLPGVDTYVYSGSGGVAAVEKETGKLLWSNRKWKIKIAACATPLPIDEERLFLSAGYGAGAMMIHIFKTEQKIWDTEVLYKLEEKIFGSVQHTPILYKGDIYGTKVSGELVCLGLDGKIKWDSGTKRFGIGPYMMIQDKMILLDSKTCDLTLVEINNSSYKELSSLNLFEGHDAYGLMAYTKGLLIVRDLKKMQCLDISQSGYKNL